MSNGSSLCTVELMLNLRLPERQSPTWYTDDPDLSMSSVNSLTTVQSC